jgi:type IV fimbrial biogenesis protein FimT
MSIAAILLAIGVPSYQNITTSTRMSGEINALLIDMNFARSEAIKRGQNVTVCPSANPLAVAPVCSTGNPLNWSTGWVVLSSGAQVLRISSGVTHGDTLTGGVAPVPVFSPIGYGQFAGTVSLHDSNDDVSQRRCLTFATGSFTTQTGATCP